MHFQEIAAHTGWLFHGMVIPQAYAALQPVLVQSGPSALANRIITGINSSSQNVIAGATHKQSVIAWPQQMGENLQQRVIARTKDKAIRCE